MKDVTKSPLYRGSMLMSRAGDVFATGGHDVLFFVRDASDALLVVVKRIANTHDWTCGWSEPNDGHRFLTIKKERSKT